MVELSQRAGLIMDLGASEGNDTAFYLQKGFRVIAVEADTRTFESLRIRFAEEIDTGALTVLNFVASNTFGEPTTFYVHKEHQGISSLTKRDYLEEGYHKTTVYTIDWKTLVAQKGVPRYLKIDIEGGELAFLASIGRNEPLPEFVSVECYALSPAEMLYELGYRRFKLIDQNPVGGFVLPQKQLEGLTVSAPVFHHASGPFGLDLFADGEWMDFGAFRNAWEQAAPKISTTWFDCHAWMPS